MDQLHISLVSNDLKYNLSSLKIKTFEKARQYMYESKDQDKVNKIAKYVKRYDDIKSDIKQKLFQASNSDNQQVITQEHIIQQVSLKNIYEKSLEQNCITEIYGQKGSGKTGFLMYLCEKYAQKSDKRIHFINCASGLSHKRWERLQKKCPNLQYRDTYTLQNILEACRGALSDSQIGFLAIDSMTNLLMQQEKTLLFLVKLFKIFNELINRGAKIVYTNYVQQWIEYRQQDLCTNHYSYYSSVTTQFIKYKYFLKKWPKTQKFYFTMIRGGQANGQFYMQSDGLLDLKTEKQ